MSGAMDSASKGKAFHYDVYLVTDPYLIAAGRTLPQVVETACDAGVDIVQFRDKDCPDADFVARALEIREIAASRGTAFVINDRLHLYGAINPDGIHVGREDAHVSEVRKVVGQAAVVGVSVHSVAEAVDAWKNGASYVAVNGVFPTGTKKLAVTDGYGLGLVSAISSAVAIPVVGIGGITVDNAESVFRSGAAGVAVVTAITMSDDPARAVMQLKEVAAQRR